MSVQALSWVFDHSPTTGSQRHVLLSIANHAGELVYGDDGQPAFEAWPGIATMTREARLARERTTTDAITAMVKAGHLERIINGAPDTRIPKDKRPNLYRMLLANGVSCGDTRCPWCGVTRSAERGDAVRPSGVSDSDGAGCRDATGKPSGEPPVEPSGETGSEAGASGALFDAGPAAKGKGRSKAKQLTGTALAAQVIAGEEWERRVAKPVCGFVALRTRVQEALDAGWTEAQVRQVLPRMTMFSRNSFDLEFGKLARPQRQEVIADRQRATGRVDL